MYVDTYIHEQRWGEFRFKLGLHFICVNVEWVKRMLKPIMWVWIRY